MNRCVFVGNLTKNPEIAQTTTGKIYCNFTIGVRENAEETTFVDCVAWEKTADLLKKYCTKGSKIAVAGRLKKDTFAKADGTKITFTKIVVEQLELCGGSTTKEKEEQDEEDLPF